MAYVITNECVDVQDRSCVEECPVDCIYEGPRTLYINPDECVDCARCEPVCPVISIFHEDDLPDDKEQFARINASMFAEIGTPGGARKVAPFAVDHAGIGRPASA